MHRPSTKKADFISSAMLTFLESHAADTGVPADHKEAAYRARMAAEALWDAYCETAGLGAPKLPVSNAGESDNRPL